MKLSSKTKLPVFTSKRKIGFTMIEIMVVTSIIVILMLIAIPAFIGVQQKATRIKCSGKIRKIMSVFQAYSHDNKGILPRTGFFANKPDGDIASGGANSLEGKLRYDSDTDEYLAKLSIWRGDVANDLFLDYFESPDDILRNDDPDASPDAKATSQDERYEQLRRFIDKFFCPTSFDVADRNLPDRWYGVDAGDNPVSNWRSSLTPDSDRTTIDYNDYFPRETSYFSTVTAHLNVNTCDSSVTISQIGDTNIDRGILLLAGRPGSVLVQDQVYVNTSGEYVSNHNAENVFGATVPPVGENVGYLDGSVDWVEWLSPTDETGDGELDDNGTFFPVSTTTQGTIWLANNR